MVGILAKKAKPPMKNVLMQLIKNFIILKVIRIKHQSNLYFFKSQSLH